MTRYPDDEVDIAILREKIQTLEEQVLSLKTDRDNALRAGIFILGTAVVSMAAWIINKLNIVMAIAPN